MGHSIFPINYGPGDGSHLGVSAQKVKTQIDIAGHDKRTEKRRGVFRPRHVTSVIATAL